MIPPVHSRLFWHFCVSSFLATKRGVGLDWLFVETNQRLEPVLVKQHKIILKLRQMQIRARASVVDLTSSTDCSLLFTPGPYLWRATAADNQQLVHAVNSKSWRKIILMINGAKPTKQKGRRRRTPKISNLCGARVQIDPQQLLMSDHPEPVLL